MSIAFREIVVELLSQQPEGAFFVRESSSSLGSYALSMVTPEGTVKHFLIEEREGQFCISLTVSPTIPHSLSLSLSLCRAHISLCSPPCQLSFSTTLWTLAPSPAPSPSTPQTLSSQVPPSLSPQTLAHSSLPPCLPSRGPHSWSGWRVCRPSQLSLAELMTSNCDIIMTSL